MRKKQINNSPILHIVLGVFLVIQTAIYTFAFFSTESKLFFIIFVIFNLYLCYFHFAYSNKIRKNNNMVNVQDTSLSDREEVTDLMISDKISESSNSNVSTQETINSTNDITIENDKNEKNIDKDSNIKSMPDASDINDFFKKHH